MDEYTNIPLQVKYIKFQVLLKMTPKTETKGTSTGNEWYVLTIRYMLVQGYGYHMDKFV